MYNLSVQLNQIIVTTKKILTGSHGITVTSSAVYPLSLIPLGSCFSAAVVILSSCLGFRGKSLTAIVIDGSLIRTPIRIPNKQVHISVPKVPPKNPTQTSHSKIPPKIPPENLKNPFKGVVKLSKICKIGHLLRRLEVYVLTRSDLEYPTTSLR